MTLELEGSVTQLFRKLQSGDASAFTGLHDRFLPRLLGVARKALASQPQRVADAEDVVQSAFLSFFRGLEKGTLVGERDRTRLWNLLAAITKHKALKQIRREGAGKRGGGNVVGESSLAALLGGDGSSGQGIEALFSEIQAPDFDLICEEMLGPLDDETRSIVVLKLMGHTNRDIASHLECTDRTVRRKLHLIRLKWEEELR